MRTGPFLTLPREDVNRQLGATFDADLDVCEFDERGRLSVSWAARALELSRSRLAFRSRRMCYLGRSVIVAVHLIDDRPVPLFGRISHCSYDHEGLYRVEIDLDHVPNRTDIAEWLAGCRRR